MRTLTKIYIARSLRIITLVVFKIFRVKENLQVTRKGIRWNLDLNEGIDLSIFLLGCFEPRTLKLYKKMLKRGAAVIDVRANVGAHTLPLAKIVGPAGLVFACEPTDYAFQKLSTNVALNPELQTQIRCAQTFLTNSLDPKGKPTNIYSSWPLSTKQNTHHLHSGVMKTTALATTTTLDQLLAELQITVPIDLIKLDVDGYELPVIQGAKENLTKHKPDIIMVVAPYTLQEMGFDFGEFIDSLSDLGYQFYTETKQHLITISELKKIDATQGKSRNVIAINRLH